MTTFTKRLDKHFAVCAAAAGAMALAGAQKADAAVVYSGIVNINVPTTTAGIYLNVATGVFAVTPAGAPGWDLNPWGSTSNNIWANNSASPTDGIVINYTGGSSATLTDNMPLGATVDGSWAYGRTSTLESTGSTAFVLGGADNYIGFRFFREGDAAGTLHFGWARFRMSAGGAQPRTLVDYAYDDVVGTAIHIGDGQPAPGALALLGVAGLFGGRRRRRD
jgi:MYXO-CTERM domain-containing protein